MSAPVLLEVRDLRAWFDTGRGPARAVDGVSFDLREGETLALVGESGCGKSVTSLSILRLLPSPPARILAGSAVRLRGEDLIGATEPRMREIRGNEIAMIFQEPMTSLNPVLTIGDQIAEAVRAHQIISRRAARARAVELLERVGLPDPRTAVSEYPHRLSGGMRQRAMIAMALACRPAVLIADEPTTALDVTTQAQILDLLRSLQRETGMALLLITHDLGVASEIADRAAVMYAGQIVEEASVPGIFDAPRHPYTEGLIRSVPDPDRPVRRLEPIRGSVPSATDWPDGCRFAPRCPYAWDRCEMEPPALQAAVRCWLVEEPDRRVPVTGAAPADR